MTGRIVTKAILCLAVLASAGPGCGHKEPAAEPGEKATPVQVQLGVVNLGVKRAERNGLKDRPAEAITWAEQVPIYGQVIPNPRASIEVRLPFAATLRPATDAPWPALGEWVRTGQLLGRLEVRVGPQERLDWQAKLVEARLKQQGAEHVLKIEEDRVNRFKSLPSQAVSPRELDEAQIRVAEARTQLAIAQAAVKLWTEALAQSEKPDNRTPWNQPLTAPAEGEVVELLARPGMVLEAGSVALRLADFRRGLLRLDLPPELLDTSPPRQIAVSAMGKQPPGLRGIGNRPEPAPQAALVRATLLGPCPQVDASSQCLSCWYEADLSGDGRGWRPGLLVKGTVAMPGADKQAAAVVPGSAPLYHQGRALVYVKLDPGRYERREVRVLGRVGDCWVLAGGVQAGEPVVYEQAQLLLSQEFNTDND